MTPDLAVAPVPDQSDVDDVIIIADPEPVFKLITVRSLPSVFTLCPVRKQAVFFRAASLQARQHYWPFQDVHFESAIFQIRQILNIARA
ncbi:MAG: hypothetical protein ACQETR_11905 [Thermodesulfobacteriota bacterium]